ncbi:hypothetical protein BJ741DRAFT_666158 [Chytriomyces cf. hyalinus JEL632]|nr:hypothetical protein BJ741DRAFT_666158 [Chytriomyces cf. hyalinus JEL632]
MLYTTSTNRFPRAEKLGLGIVEAFQQLPSTDPEPISDLAEVVIGDEFFAFLSAKMLDLTNERLRTKNFVRIYPKAVQRMEAHTVKQLLKEVADSLSFRYTALLGAGNEQAGALVQDMVGGVLAKYRGAVGKPEHGSTYSLGKQRLFQATKNLNSVTRDTRPDGIISVKQEGPYNDAVWAETIDSGLAQDLRTILAEGCPSTQQLGYLHCVCDIVSNLVDLDNGIVSDGSINGAVQDVAEAAADLNELDIESVGKNYLRLKYNKAKQSQRRQGTGSRPSNSQHH